MALILGKKIVGRKETLEYANEKFKWRKDVIIGISAFFGFWAWLLARLTNRKVIYYCIDFYSDKVIEGLFDRLFIYTERLMDKFLIKHCDKRWIISERIREGRQKYGNYDYEGNNIIIPLCYPPNYFRFNEHPLYKNTIVFIGLDPYGLELLPKNTDFIWLGKGKLLPLKELLDKLSNCGIGISLWKEKGNNYYGDPGKTKLYSVCGLPVIMTDNTPYAKIIDDTNAGLLIPYDKEYLKQAINDMLYNYDYFKNNVKKTWEYINVDEIFRNIRLLE